MFKEVHKIFRSNPVTVLSEHRTEGINDTFLQEESWNRVQYLEKGIPTILKKCTIQSRFHYRQKPQTLFIFG